MFYLLILIIIILYYIFLAPKTVRYTINYIGLVAIGAILLLLVIMFFFKLIHSLINIFLIIFMFIIGNLAWRDMKKLKNKSPAVNSELVDKVSKNQF